MKNLVNQSWLLSKSTNHNWNRLVIVNKCCVSWLTFILFNDCNCQRKKINEGNKMVAEKQIIHKTFVSLSLNVKQSINRNFEQSISNMKRNVQLYWNHTPHNQWLCLSSLSIDRIDISHWSIRLTIIYRVKYCQCIATSPDLIENQLIGNNYL